jgi:hypothetical protein
VGVYFDYFRAADDEQATATRELPGGPLVGDAASQLDGVSTKGVFPDPHLEQLVAHAQRLPYEGGRGRAGSCGHRPTPRPRPTRCRCG